MQHLPSCGKSSEYSEVGYTHTFDCRTCTYASPHDNVTIIDELAATPATDWRDGAEGSRAGILVEAR